MVDYISHERNVNGQWIAGWKTSYLYNNNGDYTQILDERYDSLLQDFQPVRRQRRLFNGQGTQTKHFSEGYDLSTQNWTVEQEIESVIDQNGKIKALMVKELTYPGVLKYRYKSFNLYNSSNLLEYRAKVSWNSTLNIWNTDTTITQHNTYNHLDQLIQIDRDDTHRSILTYDSLGRQDSSIYAYWSFDHWDTISVRRTFYDSLDNETYHVITSFNAYSGSISSIDTAFYSYNSDTLIHILENRTHRIDPAYGLHNIRQVYFYKQPSYKTNLSDHVVLFPQPAGHELKFYNTIKATSYSILHLDGRVISSGSLKEDLNIVNTQSLDKGIYLLKFHRDGKDVVQRFQVF